MEEQQVAPPKKAPEKLKRTSIAFPYHDHNEHLEDLARQATDGDGELKLPDAADWTPQTRGRIREIILSEDVHGIEGIGPVSVKFEYVVDTQDDGAMGESEWRLKGCFVFASQKPKAKKKEPENKAPVHPKVAAMAKKLNIDLKHIKGTGINGRIEESDIIKATRPKQPGSKGKGKGDEEETIG